MVSPFRGRRQLRAMRADPVKRYLLTMVVVVGVPALVLAWALGGVVVHRLSDHMLSIAGAEVQSFVEGLLPDAGAAANAVTPSLRDRTWWNGLGDRLMRNPQTVAVRAYDEHGRIVYANDANLVGMQPLSSSSLHGALKGKSTAHMLGGVLTGFQRRFTVLVPVTYGPGGPPGAIEVVQDFRSLQDELSLARWLLVGGVGLLAIVFLGALVPLTRRLARSSFLDPLTQLPNRRYLEAAARVALARNARAGTIAALFLIDLDRFKVVNDALGHRSGDRLLCAARRPPAAGRAGRRLRRAPGRRRVRVAPLGGRRDRLARARRPASRRRFELPVGVDRHTVRLDASIGIALFPRDGRDLPALLHSAEVAMYRAKSTKVPFEFYRPDLHPTSSEGLHLEGELKGAIESGALEMVYQPIRDLATGHTVAAEALVRWRHPIRGVLTPDTFIGLAEDTGLIRRIDRWTLHAAAGQLARWSRAGLQVSVSVNLSGQTATDPTLLDDLDAALLATGAPPDLLVLEVTERSAIADMESSAGILHGARDRGVQVALDDFGTGYSSLANLERLPVGYIKIDKGFVSGIGHFAKDEHLIRAITGFSRGMGIPIVAEGIERIDQLEWLRREGVPYGQGFLLARPSDAGLVMEGAPSGSLGVVA